MDKLPIDFDMTMKELSEWIDNWKVERYGKDSLNPERYYNTSEDGRFLYGVREGESLNREKADIEKGVKLLVQIKNINDKLCGKGISQHLQWQERENLERERETLYKEFTELVQSSPDAAAPEPQQGELLYYCNIAVRMGYLEKTATGYKRNKGMMSKAQLAYFLGRFLNQDETFPESKYNNMFGENRLGKALSQLADNKNGDGKPRGYEIIDELLIM